MGPVTRIADRDNPVWIRRDTSYRAGARNDGFACIPNQDDSPDVVGTHRGDFYSLVGPGRPHRVMQAFVTVQLPDAVGSDRHDGTIRTTIVRTPERVPQERSIRGHGVWNAQLGSCVLDQAFQT